jgi:hypothetical protein
MVMVVHFLQPHSGLGSVGIKKPRVDPTRVRAGSTLGYKTVRPPAAHTRSVSGGPLAYEETRDTAM